MIVSVSGEPSQPHCIGAIYLCVRLHESQSFQVAWTNSTDIVIAYDLSVFDFVRQNSCDKVLTQYRIVFKKIAYKATQTVRN